MIVKEKGKERERERARERGKKVRRAGGIEEAKLIKARELGRDLTGGKLIRLQ